MNAITANFRSLLTAVAMACVASSSILFGSAEAQQAFANPQQAVDALVAYAKNGGASQALLLFGKSGVDVISSGDDVADQAARAHFVSAYEAKHEIAMEGADKAKLTIGDNDFPFSIPVTRAKNGSWFIDVAAGRTELLYRRIGRNELGTIETCLAFVDAENDYADEDRGAGVGVYAQRFLSTPGKKDGLYWPVSQGETPSPLGQLFAEASAEGYHFDAQPTPYHGYYYKILISQGPAAPGGAADYVVNGKMIGGFALVAYPAEYRSSGVMTFLVNYSGTVYQKDLGWNTAQVASTMTAFDPDPTWKKVDTSFAPDPFWTKTDEEAAQ